MSKIRPNFNNKHSKAEIARFFDSSSDAGFKRSHPIAYKFLCFLGAVSLVLPGFALTFISQFVFDKNMDDSGWVLLGFLGSFVFGIGLFNIVAAFLNQYLGHKLTIFCLAIGLIIMALAVYLV